MREGGAVNRTIWFEGTILILLSSASTSPAEGIRRQHTESAVSSGSPVAGTPRPANPVALRRVVPGVFSADLRDLPPAPQWTPGDPIIERSRRITSEAAAPLPADERPTPKSLDGGRRAPGAHPPGDVVPLSFSPPDLDFDGSAFTGVNPPDPVGDVGSQHYIQMVNHPSGSEVTVFDKTGAVQAGPFILDSLWDPMVGGACAAGGGDPIVLYDRMADRWLMSEFASTGNHLCVYVSQTSNPIAGGWWNYDFSTPSFPDYPKYAV